MENFREETARGFRRVAVGITAPQHRWFQPLFQRPLRGYHGPLGMRFDSVDGLRREAKMLPKLEMATTETVDFHVAEGTQEVLMSPTFTPRLIHQGLQNPDPLSEA
jgi:hypothetical protein